MKTTLLSFINPRGAIVPASGLLVLVIFALALPQAGAQTGNTATGDQALANNTTGDFNTADGASALFNNTTGFSNTGEGAFALSANTTGARNTATGYIALQSNTTGGFNTASGASALAGNTTGSHNTGTGAGTLISNTTGYNNTASGSQTLVTNTSGYHNTADGAFALYFNTTGSNNSAQGSQALRSNTTGHHNAANGVNALFSNTTGTYNTAEGAESLRSNTGGNNNTATGFNALYSSTGHNNTATGYRALVTNTTGGNNIALGVNAGSNLTTGSYNINIGNVGVARDSKTIRIGSNQTQVATYIGGISNGSASGAQVRVDSDGKLGVMLSSRRFKEKIEPMDKASEAILSLKPVTFRYKRQIEPESIPQFGLVAEEVEKVNPDLVMHDEKGVPYTVRYEAVNAMLLNEFLKQHKELQELKATVAALKETMSKQGQGGGAERDDEQAGTREAAAP